MRVFVVGTRGFPNIQGGVEKHCENLYTAMINSSSSLSITVFRRKQYVKGSSFAFDCERIKFHDIWSIKNKYIETIFHSFISSVICVIKRPDLVHIHNIGPALILPILNFFRIPTIVTFHSDNYSHGKWGFFSKKVLKLGERFVKIMADRIIVVSKWQKSLFKENNNVEVIPNGVLMPEFFKNFDYLDQIKVKPGEYILAVSRFVPEKGLHLLIQAFI